MNGKTIARRAWFCLLLVAATGQVLFAQQGRNPFELTPRIPKQELSVPKPAELVPGNPFDIVAPASSPETGVFPEKVGSPTLAPLADTGKEARYRRFLFITIIEIFLILTILFTLFSSIPGRVYRAFLNDNMLGQLHREQGSIVSIPYFLFYLFFFFNAGFFLFLLSWHYDITLANRHWVSFLWLTGGLVLLFGVKHLVLKILEAVMPVQKELRTYSFTIIMFSIALGILLIPFNLLIAYGPEDAVSGVIVLALIMIALVYAFRFIRGVFIAGRFVALHLFHFLLYICTVELAPALIVAKAIQLSLNGS